MNPQILRSRLLKWYDERQRRHLPWRAQPDPYRVWISEVMLQQTQVESVIPYFERFVAAFPDVPSLAAANESDVLKLWEGLGYYSRARNLQAAAREMVARYDARVPDTPADLASLPGIGPYTAGAVLSIAYNRRTAAVDGNVLRVLARFYAIREPIDRPQVKKRLTAAAAELVDPERPGDFNQALMELGALVCRPHRPDCQSCPLAWSCAAFASGEPEVYGRKAPKRAVPVHHWAAAFLRRGDHWLLCRRVPEGLLGGLWELPAAALTGDEAPEAALVSLLEARFGVAAEIGALLAQATHTFSHQRWQVRAFAAACRGEPALQATTTLQPAWLEARWCGPAQMAALPLTTLTRRLFAAAGVELPSGPGGLKRAISVRTGGEGFS